MKKISLESISFRLLYYQYKEYFIFFVIIFVSVLLFLFIIIPQIQDFFLIRAEVDRYKEKNELLKGNISYIGKLDDGVLDSQFKTVSLALSTKKDFVNIVNSLSRASEKTGVELGDFSFEVGDLSTNSARLTASPVLSLNITVAGKIDAVHAFVNALYAQIPLMSISSLQLTEGSATIRTEFPYKPYVAGSLNTTTRFVPFSNKEQQVLADIEEWSDNSELAQ
jgi:hypothetical protein